MMLKKKSKYNVAVVGAEGLAGRELVDILSDRNFPVGDLHLLDTGDAAGERVEYQGRNIVVRETTRESFAGTDLAFFFSEPAQSLAFAPSAVTAGAVVIDSSGAFSTAPNAPLVVPEVNPQAIATASGIIANPSSLAVALAMVLKPIHTLATVKRVVVTAVLSVSGSGKKGMDELASQTVALLNFREVENSVYPHQIAFNCLPQDGTFLENGQSQAEAGLAGEIGKILNDASLRMSVTTVCVPVFRGHAASLAVETGNGIEVNELRAHLASGPGVIVYDDPRKNIYPIPIDVVGKDEIFVGRIRVDGSVDNGFNLWLALDNLRKGSALNAVQIAELMMQ